MTPSTYDVAELHGSGCRHLEGGDRVAGRRSKRREGSREARMRLLTIVSHDLKSPLAAIKAHSDNLLDGVYGEIRGEAKKRIRQIRRIAMDGAAMVEEVLSIAGPAAETRCPDVRETLREVAASLRQRSGPRAVRLEVRAPQGLPSLPVSRALIRAAVRNLAENAMRASPVKGAVRIEARREKGRIRIQVLDRGAGGAVPWEERVLGREGIGLRIVREIVQGHGGEVFASRRRGGGSVVGFSVPHRAARGGTRETRRRSP